MPDKTSESNINEEKEPISLSAALLAPINSIFEAQIHSARAFLNFILQMGFRHQPTPDELEGNEKLQNEQKQKEEGKESIRKLLKKKQQTGALTKDEIAKLKELSINYGDLYHQSIDFIDQNGNDIFLGIPNLALLPIKPLAINEAEFTYQFAVASEDKAYKQMGAALKKDEDRPWFLIKEPKSIRGSFTTSNEKSMERSIKINVKVGSTEIPYGLEKLLVHLTNSMEAIDKTEE